MKKTFVSHAIRKPFWWWRFACVQKQNQCKKQRIIVKEFEGKKEKYNYDKSSAVEFENSSDDDDSIGVEINKIINQLGVEEPLF